MTKNIPKGPYGDIFEEMYYCSVMKSNWYSTFRGLFRNFAKNPLPFENFGDEPMRSYVNGRLPLKWCFQMNMAENMYSDALLSLYRATGKLWEDTDTGITREVYKDGKTFIAFNVDPKSTSDCWYLDIPRFEYIHLNIRV